MLLERSGRLLGVCCTCRWNVPEDCLGSVVLALGTFQEMLGVRCTCCWYDPEDAWCPLRNLTGCLSRFFGNLSESTGLYYPLEEDANGALPFTIYDHTQCMEATSLFYWCVGILLLPSQG